MKSSPLKVDLPTIRSLAEAAGARVIKLGKNFGFAVAVNRRDDRLERAEEDCHRACSKFMEDNALDVRNLDI